MATFKVFGTTAVLLVTDQAAADRARAIADAQLAAVDLACSRFRPDSELSRQNASHGAVTHVSELFAELVAAELGVGVLVSLGGDIAVAGPPPGDGWHVKATDDHAASPDAQGQTVTVSSGGLATSSTTVRAWAAGGRQHHSRLAMICDGSRQADLPDRRTLG